MAATLRLNYHCGEEQIGEAKMSPRWVKPSHITQSARPFPEGRHGNELPGLTYRNKRIGRVPET